MSNGSRRDGPVGVARPRFRFEKLVKGEPTDEEYRKAKAELEKSRPSGATTSSRAKRQMHARCLEPPA